MGSVEGMEGVAGMARVVHRVEGLTVEEFAAAAGVTRVTAEWLLARPAPPLPAVSVRRTRSFDYEAGAWRV